jgi:hypothetical protein
MAIANTTIRIKKSGVEGNVPSDLNLGEIALNYRDGKLFYKNHLGDISYITSDTSSNSFSTINVSGQLIFAQGQDEILSVNSVGDIIVFGDDTSKTITIDGSILRNSINAVATNLSSNVGLQDGINNTQNTYILNINSFAGSAYNQANAATTLAQNAYNYANTIASGGATVTIQNDITDNNIVYPTFVKNTSGNTSVLYTSNNHLTYNANTGALNVVQLNISPNTSIMGGVNTEIQIANTVLDSFSVDTYRSAFYQIQINHLLEFHILNLNIVHDYPGSTVYSSKYGEVITNVSLGDFYPTVNLTSGMVEVHFSPTYPTQTGVTFSKTMLAKFGLTVPVGDLGYVNDPVTVTFDAGFDSDPAVANFDYGTVP